MDPPGRARRARAWLRLDPEAAPTNKKFDDDVVRFLEALKAEVVPLFLAWTLVIRLDSCVSVRSFV